MGGTKRDWADVDIVPSFSDSDDIPDLDGADDSDVARSSEPKKKRFRSRAKEDDEEDKEEEESTKWTSNGHDDGAFNPDFHFEDDAEGVVQELREFDLPGNQRSAKQVVGIEEIIRRRRLAKGNDYPVLKVASATGAVSDISSEEDNHEGSGIDDAPNPGYEVLPRSDEEEMSDEEDAVVAPMPEIDGYGSEDEAGQHQAKRDAFFAPPEDDATDPKAPSKISASFLSLNLSRPILRGVTSIGFTSPTPIQSKAIPVALMGKDIVGGAETGSGKTAAFLLPILERLLYRSKKIATTRVSILLPTRELAVQCYNVAKKLAQFTDISFALIVGGLSLREQEQTLKKRPDVVVATPGRFIDHMRNTVSFAVRNLEILVLDEADRMLEEGFADELNEVLNTIPRSRQTMLFSATMTQDVDKLIRVGMNKPARLMVDSKQQTVSGLVQEFVRLKNDSSRTQDVVENRRLATLLHLCKVVYPSQTIVFIPTRALAHRLKILFALQGLKGAELHGSMSQEQRLSAIASFSSGTSTHLLATDLASRGLDIPRVETVINYTVPTTKETYVHRVGRTARAGRSGTSCTLFSAVKTSGTKGKGSSKVSERALLKPILRLAKSQKAPMRTRNLPAGTIDALSTIVGGLEGEIEEIMKEEKEERLLAETERDMTKSENMIEHEKEIMSRPRRTWFQTEQDKKAAKATGKEARMGLENGAEGSKKTKRKLSGKHKKRLEAKDLRESFQGFKRRKSGHYPGSNRTANEGAKPSKKPKGKGRS